METAVGLARLLLLNGATAVAAVGLASRLHLDSRAERLLAACVLATGIATLTALPLGIAGWLRYWPLLAAQLPFVVAAALVGRWHVVRSLLDVRGATKPLRGRGLRFALGLLAVTYACAFLLGLVAEPFAGDALMYHLPLMAEYAHEGTLGIPSLGRYWGNKYWAYYPGGAYLLYLWILLPFGNGAFVDLVQFPFAFASALATYTLARVFGAVRRDAAWAAILFLAVPIVIGQLNTPLVDLTLTYLFAAGMVFLLARPLTPSRLLLGAIAWGVAPAVKLPAIAYLVLGAVCVAANQLDGGVRARQALAALTRLGAALAAGFLIFSGYWFARNWWLMGSPVYPLNLNPSTPPVWSNILVYGLLFPLLDFSPSHPKVFNYETGAGPQLMCLAVPALVAFGSASARARRAGIASVALIPIVAYFLWLYRLSTSVQTLLRYVVPAMPIAFAAFAWSLPRVARPTWLTRLAAFCVFFSVGIAVPRLGTYTNTEVLRLGLAKWRRGETHGPFEVMGALDVQDYRRTWAYVASLSEPQDIATSHLIFTYPLRGTDFRHRLHVIEDMDRDAWLAEIGRRGVDLLVLAELVDPSAAVDIGDTVRLKIDYRPGGDEYAHVSRRLDGRPVRAMRLTYTSTGAENARLFVAGNGFDRARQLPLSPGGDERTETVSWEGELSSLELLLEYVPRTAMRGDIDVTIASLEVQYDDGTWEELTFQPALWEMLRWPVEYYWAQALRPRFQLVMRDEDFVRNPYSGEVRVYRVEARTEGDASPD